MSLLFQTTGNTSSGKYTDTYEAKFVHGSKKNFSGEEMNILDFNGWLQYNITN